MRVNRLLHMHVELDTKLTESKVSWSAILRGTHTRTCLLQSVPSVRYLLSSEACLETMKECLGRMEMYRMAQMMELQEEQNAMEEKRK